MTTAARAYRTANRRKSNARSIRPAANSTDSCKKVRHHHRSGEYYASVADALAPGRVSREPWNKCGRGIAAFMPRKPLDALEGARRSGQLPGMFFHPRRLPHGECGVWGSAPGVTATAPPDARNMSKYPRIPLTNQKKGATRSWPFSWGIEHQDSRCCGWTRQFGTIPSHRRRAA